MKLDLSKSIAMPMSFRFTARLEGGYFSFSELPPVKAARAKPNTAIFIEKISLSANCKDFEFSAANESGIKLNFYTEGGKDPIMLRPLTFYAFSDFMQVNAISKNGKTALSARNINNQDNMLLAAVDGKIKQTADLIKSNISELSITFSVIAYEIYDKELVNELSGNGNRGGESAPAASPKTALPQIKENYDYPQKRDDSGNDWKGNTKTISFNPKQNTVDLWENL